MSELSYMEQRRHDKIFGKAPVKKERYVIPKKSAKRIETERADKENQADTPQAMRLWFKERRKEMTGTCHCGCGKPSSKKDDMLYKHSCCHIFPKAHYKSVKIHPKNCIELAFYGGCHTNMDDRSVEKWPNMECWPEIKEKVLILYPLLSPEEKGRKFVTKLMELVNKF